MAILEDFDLWNSDYRPSLGISLLTGFVALFTTVLIAIGHAQGTLNAIDTVGWLVAGSGVIMAIAGLDRSR